VGVPEDNLNKMAAVCAFHRKVSNVLNKMATAALKLGKRKWRRLSALIRIGKRGSV